MSLKKRRKAEFTGVEFTVLNCQCSIEEAEKVIAEISGTRVMINMVPDERSDKNISFFCSFEEPIGGSVLGQIARSHGRLKSDKVTTRTVYSEPTRHHSTAR